MNMNDLHIAVMPKDILALSEPHLPTEYSTAMSVEWQKESLGASLVSFDDYVYVKSANVLHAYSLKWVFLVLQVGQISP